MNSPVRKFAETLVKRHVPVYTYQYNYASIHDDGVSSSVHRGMYKYSTRNQCELRRKQCKRLTPMNHDKIIETKRSLFHSIFFLITESFEDLELLINTF